MVLGGMTMRVHYMWAAATFLLAACGKPQVAQEDPAGTNWSAVGRTHDEQHYSPLDQITDQNIDRLGLAWFTDLAPTMNSFSGPLEVDGVLYFATGLTVLHAMDARTGKELWSYDSKVY